MTNEAAVITDDEWRAAWRLTRQLGGFARRRKFGRRYRKAKLCARIPASRRARKFPRRYIAFEDRHEAHVDIPRLDELDLPVILAGQTPKWTREVELDERGWPVRRRFGLDALEFYPDGSPIERRSYDEEIGDRVWAVRELARVKQKHHRVAYTSLHRDGVVLDVSTAYIGLDMASPFSTLPIIYETMIFHNGSAGECWRYSTREAAAAGHRAVVAVIRADNRRHWANRGRRGPSMVPPLAVAYRPRGTRWRWTAS